MSANQSTSPYPSLLYVYAPVRLRLDASLCVQILRVRYESPSEWRGLIKAQQETLRVERFNPQVVSDAYQRGKEAGNNPRLVVQVRYCCRARSCGTLVVSIIWQPAFCNGLYALPVFPLTQLPTDTVLLLLSC